MAVGLYPLYTLLTNLADEVAAVVEEVVAVHAVAGEALAVDVVLAPAGGHMLAGAEVAGLYLVERHDAAAADAAAGTACHGIAETDVELEHLVELVSVLLLVLYWSLDGDFRAFETCFFLRFGTDRRSAEQWFTSLQRFLLVHCHV